MAQWTPFKSGWDYKLLLCCLFSNNKILAVIDIEVSLYYSWKMEKFLIKKLQIVRNFFQNAIQILFGL